MKVPRKRSAIDLVEKAARPRVPVTATPLAGSGPTDHGVVEALPGSASVGDRCTFKAATGIYWELIYVGGSSPWAKIGGPPIRAEDTAERTTKSATPQTTNAPSVNAPLAGTYDIEFGATFAQPKTASDTGCGVKIFVDGVDSGSTKHRGASTDHGSAVRAKRRLTVAAGKACQTRYLSEFAEREAGFSRLFVEIDPVLVG